MLEFNDVTMTSLSQLQFEFAINPIAIIVPFNVFNGYILLILQFIATIK